MATYIVDSNFFIDAHRRTYPIVVWHLNKEYENNITAKKRNSKY